MEGLILTILELLFVYPGALIRWILFYRGRKTVKQVARDDLYKNSYIGILFLGMIFGVIYTVIKA